jgi:hypothetical protein
MGELDLGVQAGGLEVDGEPVDEARVVAAARTGVDDDDDAAPVMAVGERCQALRRRAPSRGAESVRGPRTRSAR